MAAFAAGAVVLVPFPFSDLSQAKLRPAVVLADVRRGDFILWQVTSNPYGDPTAVTLLDEWFLEGSLRRMCNARPMKIFTANESLIVARVAILQAEAVVEITDRIVRVLRTGRIDQDADPLLP